MYNTTTKIELPFNGQCLGNGTFMFNVDFRLFEFKDLLLTNRDATTNNIDKCLRHKNKIFILKNKLFRFSFLFCYESPSEYVKPQFKVFYLKKNNFTLFIRLRIKIVTSFGIHAQKICLVLILVYAWKKTINWTCTFHFHSLKKKWGKIEI